MTYKQQLVFIFFLFYISSINCQGQQLQDSDSLVQNDFLYLETKFNSPKTSDANAKLYAIAYLKKAKRINDTKKIIDGYYFKGLVVKDSLKRMYIDSIINLSKKRTDHYRMEDVLVMKASILYLERHYKKAIDLYIEAQTYAQQSNNTNMLFNIEYNMGIIYNLIGDPKNGLTILRKSLKNFEKLDHQNDWMRLQIISSLVTSYKKQGMYDSVRYHTKKAINQTHGKPKYERLYNMFLLKDGMTLYAKKKYVAAMDSIQKTIPYFEQKEDDSNLVYAYYYLGKTYLKKKNSVAAIHNFRKVDSISQKVNYLFPETRATYEILIDHYKSKENAKKQLIYIERLLRLDSIVHDKELYLTKQISESYNTPRLLSDKQQIITSFQKKEDFYFVLIIGAIILIILIGGFLVFHYVQRNIYKKRFELLLKNQEDTKKIIVPNVSEISKNDLTISEDIVESVLKKLAIFKENNGFLVPNITLLKLAKKLKTNHTYLSKIINMYEGKSFNSFINNLRIEHTIKRLQTDAIFRKYTIDAIAEESGFSNTRTFSRAFQRKTNLNPSYFIKNLNASYSE